MIPAYIPAFVCAVAQLFRASAADTLGAAIGISGGRLTPAPAEGYGRDRAGIHAIIITPPERAAKSGPYPMTRTRAQGRESNFHLSPRWRATPRARAGELPRNRREKRPQIPSGNRCMEAAVPDLLRRFSLHRSIGFSTKRTSGRDRRIEIASRTQAFCGRMNSPTNTCQR